MNKKLLSGVLIGAMLVTSAGSFVSCQKDYDDDIDSLEQRMQSVESTVNSLNSQISSGKWITSLSSVTGGFSVTFSDGSSYTITNGKDGADGKDGAAGEKGADGKDGSTVTVNEDGYWVIDGVVTEYVASKSAETGAKSPYVGEDGYWYFYNEDGEAEKSDYKAVGAAYAAYNSTTGVWTLYIPDGSGALQTIELPTAASKITGIAFTNASANGALAIYKQTFTRPNRWGGSRTLPATGDVIYGSADKLEIQVSPSDVAKDIKAYTLVNSKNTTLGLALTPSAYDGLIAATGTRAASNGLYYLAVAPQVVAKASTKAVDDAIAAKNNGEAAGYAVEADGVFRSAYKVALSDASTVPALASLAINKGTAIAIESTSGTATVDVNATNKVTFDKEAAVYDSYLDVPSSTSKALYGIVLDGNTFKVTKSPDATTAASGFDLYVYTLDIAGKVKTTIVHINLSDVISGATTLAAQTVDVSETYPGFGFSVSDMGLSSDQKLSWNSTVVLANTTYELYDNSDLKSNHKVTTVDFSNSSLIAPSLYTARYQTPTKAEELSIVSFDIKNSAAATAGLKLDTQYYVKVTFKSASSNVNSVVIPVTFTAPTVAERFAVKDAYVVNGVINAYFTKTDGGNATANKELDLYQYFSEYDETVALAWDSETTIVKDSYGVNSYKSDDLAEAITVTPATSSAAATAKFTLAAAYDPYIVPQSQYELGYGKELVLVVGGSSTTYEGWAYKNDSDKSAQYKVKVMSPINEGEVKSATGSTITINAADAVNGAKITDSMIKGYDYNNNAYNVVKEWVSYAAKYKDARISGVVAGPHDTQNLITVNYVEATGPASASDTTTPAVNGYFNVTAASISNTTTVKLPVVVTDAWGYELSTTVDVQIQKN